ncbi:MAG TPA: ferritin family protein [Spirochaetota bacterium]|nr:ferritin family protein [Spirochaetota bacterium]HPJ42281.1 ferritin family protein [Spirochaetota bacterium]HPR37010.1 ferritin family protein [Spirochaetota bacterium]HRX47222.1 ferritin family protein [Spirochaetota bacterium]
MEDLKKRIRESFRMEMIGTGMYRALAAQYSGKAELSRRFMEFADQEEMHGRMFRELYRKNFGEEIGSGRLWLYTGKTAAFVIRPLSLEKKMKKLSIAESDAVKRIEEALAGECEPGFRKIISRILPDEKAHAALYGEIFG